MQFSRELFLDALKAMDRAFRRMEAAIPPPQPMPSNGNIILRYEEQLVEQALIQKLARFISGLRSIDLLLLNGFFQEQAVIQRTLDEIGEDIHFLSLSLTNDTLTPLHIRYLDAFWAEEFDAKSPIESTQKRDYPSRRSITAYVVRMSGSHDPSTFSKVNRTLHKTYSGFVHGASPQIMDMCGGNPPKFFIRGMNGTSRIQEYVEDAWNYFYRGLLATTVVAKSFGSEILVESLYNYIDSFENVSGTNFRKKSTNS